MHAAQGVEQPVAIPAVALVERRPAVGGGAGALFFIGGEAPRN